ncbi:translation initiation factor IF-2-like [Monodelphis domestica]|uniref:translation initiation factor IF-2-like n=1 Tax=Monodelphis domestica TaxID=13616 RepID=UPI0024E1C6A4|nr:translation initiation factor IF-2-like [Monodelphis domestica]
MERPRTRGRQPQPQLQPWSRLLPRRAAAASFSLPLLVLLRGAPAHGPAARPLAPAPFLSALASAPAPAAPATPDASASSSAAAAAAEKPPPPNPRPLLLWAPPPPAGPGRIPGIRGETPPRSFLFASWDL